MGLRDKYAKRDATAGFEPLELTEGNVQAIFNRCGKLNEDGTTTWNEEKLVENQVSIRYLLGQLALVHSGDKEHEMDNALFRRYDGQDWTNSRKHLINLLNMGGKSDFCVFFKKDGKQFVQLKLTTLTPTLSPKDPGFQAWWETAEILLFRAEIAEEKGNYTEALSLYEKAAELGNVDAQFKAGRFYAFGYMGTTKDNQAAFKWFQMAAKQGHGCSQFLSDLMCKKGLTGNKIIDLESELSKLLDNFKSLSDREIDYFMLYLYEFLSDNIRYNFDKKYYASLEEKYT